MKKFISALTSLVLTATAMGGTLAMNTSAAASSVTEVTFCTGTDHATEITAEPGQKIPVDIYITKSAGFLSASMKMVIKKDGELAFGKDGRGSSYDAAWLEKNEPASALSDIETKMKEAGVTPGLTEVDGKKHWRYGSYGFEFGIADGADADNGYITDKIQLGSGYYCGAGEQGGPGQFSFWNPAEALMSYMNEGASKYDGAGYADLYAPFEDSGLALRKWKTEGTPIYTWDGSTDAEKEMIYRHVLNTITLTVPTDAVDGTYTLDLLTDDYYLPTSISWCHTNFQSPEFTDNTLAVKALTIKVGSSSGTTTSSTSSTSGSSKTESTTTSSTTSSSSSSQTGSSATNGTKPVTPAGTIQFDLLPMEGENDVDYAVSFDGKNNVINAEPGAHVVMALYASNDPGCEGQLVYMDFSEVKFGLVDVDSSSAYSGVTPTANAKYANTNDALGQKYVSIVWVATKTLKAAEGEPIAIFEIDVPETKGTYTIGEKDSVKVDLGDGTTASRKTTITGQTDVDYVFYGLKIVAGAESSESTTTTSSSTSKTETTTTTSSSSSVSDTTTTTSSTSSSSVSSVDGDKVWGDVTEDGKVTISDVILLNKALAKNATLSDQAQKNADTDGSGKLTADDALLIKGFLAKFIDAGSSDVAALKAMLK